MYRLLGFIVFFEDPKNDMGRLLNYFKLSGEYEDGGQCGISTSLAAELRA